MPAGGSLVLLVFALAAGSTGISSQAVASESRTTTRALLASGPASGRVSIYDGVLPSPDLGPQIRSANATVPAPAEATLAVSPLGTTHMVHCGAGCIAGSVIGGTVGLALIFSALIYLCCRRSTVKDDTLSTTDLELLDNAATPAQSISMLTKTYSIGEEVFCRKGRNCTFGKVLKATNGDEYTVQFFNGDSATVKGAYMAPNYVEGTEVWYTPPDGRPSVRGTVIQADGSYWPPFYQLTPHSGSVDLVNTTAECLEEARKGPGAHQIVATAV